METRDVVVIGAGIAGLTLARALREQGLRPLVLERSTGVGGRCATRRVEGIPVDHGLPFLHGRDPRFLAELRAVEECTPVPGWPARREGHGVPCQPTAFEDGSFTMAFREGLSSFPKHLARGLEIQRGAEVTGLSQAADLKDRGTVAVALRSGATVAAGVVVLTVPVPTSQALLESISPPSSAAAGLLPVLRQVRLLPSLTLIARYPEADADRPAWDVRYPAESSMIHSILNDSSKRSTLQSDLTLVIQARPGFSRTHLEDPSEAWAGALLAECARLLGPWAGRPALHQAHRWRCARVDPVSELTSPLLVTLEGGASVGLCGEAFHPGGGAQGAYLSALALSAQLELIPTWIQPTSR